MDDSAAKRLLQCLEKSCRTVISLRQELARKEQESRDIVQNVISSLIAIREKAEEREMTLEACQRQLNAVRLQNESLVKELNTLKSGMSASAKSD